MREGACALQVNVHRRGSHGMYRNIALRFLHSLREIFHSGMFGRSRSGYCDLKGFQVDLSAQFFWGRLMCFLTGRLFENIFLEIHYWRFAWKFNVRWNFVLGWNSMPSRLGVLSGSTRTSNMSISGVRCTQLEFYVEIVEIYNFRKIQRGTGKWATKYFWWFS